MNSKYKWLLSLLTLSLIAGCGGTTSNTNSNSTNDTSSSSNVSTTSNGETLPLSISYLQSVIRTLGNNLNFKLEYITDDETYFDIYNNEKGYYYNGYQNLGVMELPSVYGDDYLYNFQIENNNISIGTISNASSIADVTYMKTIASYLSQSNGLLTEKDDYTIVWDDPYAGAYFAGLLGYSPSTFINLYPTVEFTLDSHYNLQFQIVISNQKEKQFSGTFLEVNQVSMQLIEDYISNYVPIGKPLPNNALNLANSHNLRVDAEFKIHDSSELISKEYLSYNDEYFTSTTYGKAETYVDIDGYAKMPSIDVETGN